MAFWRRLAEREYKFAAISGNTDGFTVVAAVTGKWIRVIAISLSISAAGTVTLKSDTTVLGTIVAKTADPTYVAKADEGLVQTAAGEALKIGNATTLTVSGYVTYVEI